MLFVRLYRQISDIIRKIGKKCGVCPTDVALAHVLRHFKILTEKYNNLKALNADFLGRRIDMTSETKIDEIDVCIIRTLQKDARTNFAEIAKSCNVSVDTISKRFRKLIRTGVARGTTILLNPKSFGYDCVASFGILVDYPHIDDVVDFIGKIPEIVFSTPCMGRHNIFAIAVLKNVGRLGQVKEHIQGHPMVREVTVSIWVDEILLCPENFEFESLKEK